MADIRCPMCGKNNPAGRDTCQHCQARLTPVKSGPPSEPLGTPAASEAGDWLSDFRSDEAGESSFDESEAGGGGDFGDWFSRLEEPAAAELGMPAQKPQAEEEALPDWLSEPGGTPAQAEEPDWLKDFHAQAADEAVPGPEKSYEDDGQLGSVDWLSALGSAAAPAGDEARPAETAGFGEAAGPESELPDWMKPAPEADTFLRPAAAPESVPDWMREIGGDITGGEVAGSEATGSEAAISGAIEDELYGIEGAASLPPEGTVKPTGFGDLIGFGEPVEPGASFGGGEIAESAEMGEMPDWLKAQMPPSAGEESSSLFADTRGEPDLGWAREEGLSGTQAAVPDWLAEAAGPAEGTTEEAEAAAEEIPSDWFTKFGITAEEQPAAGTPAFTLGEDELTPFVSGDEIVAEPGSGGLEAFPDWLSQVPAEEPAPEAPSVRAAAPAEVEEAETDLAPAQLPTWLEAMRPVESAAPAVAYTDESGAAIETAGPLAGLRGVLPAEAEIARIRKPPVYSNKLQVSEAHQARVSLLEELVAAEGQPKPVAAHIAIVPQTALRLAIAIVLILATLGGLYISDPEGAPEWAPLPDPAEVQEVDKLRGLIETLPAEAAVLVAFDYDPGFTAEMEAAAGEVVTHLIERRTPLYLVSTNPLGPALAERLTKQQVDKLNENTDLSTTTPYTTALFTDLGYIPGGIAGLRAFAETPAQIFPQSLDAEEVWTTAPLTTGATLAGFTLALVITDNPDTARAWIEQAEPLMGSAALLMVVSAQAEPLIRPYYDSGQVQGLVSGMAGGAAYENLRGHIGLASGYWDTFSLGLVVATILILIGGLANASLATLARNKRKGEGQPYA